MSLVGILPLWIVLYNHIVIGLSFFLLYIPFISSVFRKKIKDSNASGAHRICTTIQSHSGVNLMLLVAVVGVVVVVFERAD